LNDNFAYWDLIKFIHGCGANYGGADSKCICFTILLLLNRSEYL
jgi:hypothetical protein